MIFFNYFKNQNFTFYIITFFVFNLIIVVLGIVLSFIYICIKNIECNVLNSYELKKNNENETKKNI